MIAGQGKGRVCLRVGRQEMSVEVVVVEAGTKPCTGAAETRKEASATNAIWPFAAMMMMMMMNIVSLGMIKEGTTV